MTPNGRGPDSQSFPPARVDTSPMQHDRPPVDFVDPASHEPLLQQKNALLRSSDGRTVASLIDGKWRFVDPSGHYAHSFGWQWKRWSTTLSDAANNVQHRFGEIMKRTGFDRYDLAGKSLLECGCGSGNDTEVLQRLPLNRICSFDLTTAIDATTADLADPRLTVFQADLNAIPFKDHGFDVVYCHRVLQHTPDPEASLRAICKKVKPGGIIFAHCYNSTPLQDRQYHHKYRWLTNRMPLWLVAALLSLLAPLLRFIWVQLGVKRRIGDRGWWFCFQWVPLHFTYALYDHLGPRKRLDVEKLITFDRLTAWYENHLTGADFRRILESEGFTIDSLMCDEDQPVWATATRNPEPSINVMTHSPAQAVAADARF